MLGGCKRHQVPFGMVEQHQAMFPTIDFLVKQILRIVGFQVEIKRIFFLLAYLI
jgi:hypothetical protein